MLLKAGADVNKLYLGCAIHFGKRKPYVDLSDSPQYTCVHEAQNVATSPAIEATIGPALPSFEEVRQLKCFTLCKGRNSKHIPIKVLCDLWTRKTLWNLAVTYTQKVPSQQKQETLRNQYDSVISLAKLGHVTSEPVVQQGDPRPLFFAFVLLKVIAVIDAADDCYHLILQAWFHCYPKLEDVAAIDPQMVLTFCAYVAAFQLQQTKPASIQHLLHLSLHGTQSFLQRYQVCTLIQYGSTPLHKAAEKGQYDVVVVLLSYSADGTLQDTNGRTALDLIVLKYKEDMAPLFLKNSAESLTDAKKQIPQNLSATEVKLRLVEKRASIGDKRAVVAEKRASVAEERAVVAEKRASVAEERAEKRASVAEERAVVAEKRASVAEERIKASEMEAIAAEKKATNAVAKVTIFEDRTRKAEDAVKMLQDAARISDARIAELVQTNAALEGRATRAELQIRNLTSQCRQLQEQLDKGKTPSWIVKKEDILLTDKELGRGGWGVVKAARFCGLEVAAKLLHGAILSPHNQQLFKREMNMAASVRHPNILLFIGATIDQECVILTELMQTSLRAVLEDKVTNGLSMSRQQVSNIAMDVGKALNYLHLMKPDAIIHRDVSSSNVLLEPLGAHMWIAKLSDFGSSNFARQVTTAGPGNFTYAAPESSDPDLQSPKMDVFSYGILLLEMSGGCFLEVKIRQDLIQALSWSKMQTMVLECTAKDPKRRPSMAEVLIKLPNI
eukprot:Em0016g427a